MCIYQRCIYEQSRILLPDRERDAGFISKDIEVTLKEIKEKHLCGYMTWKSSSARIGPAGHHGYTNLLRYLESVTKGDCRYIGQDDLRLSVYHSETFLGR